MAKRTRTPDSSLNIWHHTLRLVNNARDRHQNRRVFWPLTPCISDRDTQSNAIADVTGMNCLGIYGKLMSLCTFIQYHLYPMESLDLRTWDLSLSFLSLSARIKTGAQSRSSSASKLACIDRGFPHEGAFNGEFLCIVMTCYLMLYCLQAYYMYI